MVVQPDMGEEIQEAPGVKPMAEEERKPEAEEPYRRLGELLRLRRRAERPSKT